MTYILRPMSREWDSRMNNVMTGILSRRRPRSGLKYRDKFMQLD
jgi:hypothetical protein